MKTLTYSLLLTAAACALTTVHAQELVTAPGASSAPQRITNEATSETGSLIKKQSVYGSNLPLNKTYGQLTPEQRAEFHAMYQSLPAGDEPPFPEEGLKSVYGAIKKAQTKLQARGELNMAVTVGPDGKAKQVADLGGTVDNPEMTKFAAQVLMFTKYKPAVCSGKPCTMQFPLNLKLRGS